MTASATASSLHLQSTMTTTDPALMVPYLPPPPALPAAVHSLAARGLSEPLFLPTTWRSILSSPHRGHPPGEFARCAHLLAGARDHLAATPGTPKTVSRHAWHKLVVDRIVKRNAWMPLDNVIEDEAPDGAGHVLLVAGRVLVLEFHFEKVGAEAIKGVKFDPAGDPFDAATRAQVEAMLLRLLKAGMAEAAVRAVEELLRADHIVINVAQLPSSEEAGGLASMVYRSWVAAWSDLVNGFDGSMPVRMHERKLGATAAYFTTPGWQGGVVPAPGPSPGVYTLGLALGEGGQAQVLADPSSTWASDSELATVSNMHWSIVLDPPLPVCSATLDAIQSRGAQDMITMSLPDPSQSYLTLLPLRCPKSTLTLSPTHAPAPATILTHIQLLHPSHLSPLLPLLKRQAALNAFLDGFAGCPTATATTRVMATVHAGAPELAVDVLVPERRVMVKATFMDDGVWRVTVVSDGQEEQEHAEGQVQGESEHDEGKRQERVERMEKVLNTVGKLELWARWLLECL